MDGALFNALCQAHGLPIPEPEYRFHPKRKWRFDWAWVAQKTALEIEGGVWVGGRHTRGKGYTNDLLKYSEAAILGWKVIRVTPQMVDSGVAFELVRRAMG